MSLRRRPHFIIGGAPRCGTTYLAERLSRHPQICMSAAKEPWYFVIAPEPQGVYKLLRLRTRGYHHRGPQWYESQFAHCRPGQIVGEGSVGYLQSEESARMIRDACPDVKLLFMLRDPVDRIVSQYLFDLRYWRLPTLEQMIATGDERLDRLVDASCYARHLERFYGSFPREHIEVLFLEDLRTDAAAIVASALSFVGADPGIIPADSSRSTNETRLSRSRFAAQLFRSRPLPFARLQAPWERIADAVVRVNSRPSDVTVSPGVRARLWDMVRADFERLPDVIGRPVTIGRERS
jgi:hypothetical protein